MEPEQSGRSRIGIFGGTFDPVHVGHLVAAVNAKQGATLDKVLLVVANVPWQKEHTRVISPAHLRYSLVQAAGAGVDGLEACDIEIRRGGQSFTIDTVVETARDYPNSEIFLIVGADAAMGISSWGRSDKLAELVTLVVVNRPGTAANLDLDQRWRTLFVEVPAIDISSTDIRARVKDGRPLDYILTRETIEYIRTTGLYYQDLEHRGEDRE